MKSTLVVVALAYCIVSTVHVSCQPFNDTLYALLKDHDNSTRFVHYAGQTGLNLTLKDPYESLTVFAPSNQAFDQLPKDVKKELENDLDLLTDVMTFHFYQGLVSLSVNNALSSSLAGAQARINLYTNPKFNMTTVSGVPVIQTQSFPGLRNGVLYLVDKVMFPIPTGTALTFVNDDKFSMLNLALAKAGMTSFLDGKDADVTILAPSDEAFGQLPPGFFDDLLQDVPLLTKVLQNHIVRDVWYSAYFVAAGGGSMTTMAGQQLDVTLTDDDTTLQIGDASVTQSDVSVTNGVVHVINCLLLPADVRGKVGRPEMRTV
ncbi:hypothetical protein BaRGS_00022038 [Batillaria attramentaria]|uniref:FAS1 domain-containing protein n=1 Tax=Batillaria attramentaria TaxID=370345 RepID=A0ABD0KHV2_9CAEN